MNEKLIESLNGMLAQEHACAIRYATHAAVIEGPYSETVAARLQEVSQDELLHAGKLRERILALGGEPTLEVHRESLTRAKTLEDILSTNLAEERRAIQDYTAILESISPSNVILHETIREILRDEQEHLEELEALRRPR